MTALCLSLFTDVFDHAPRPRDTDWATFVKDFLPHEFVDGADRACPRRHGAGMKCSWCGGSKRVSAKLFCPAWSPARYAAGQRRSNKAVEGLRMLVFDLDAVTDPQLDQFLDAVELRDLAMLLCTTWSQGDPTKPGHRLRAIFPLSREVLRAEWAVFWGAANASFEHISDTQCKDPSRLYFGAFAPKGREKSAYSNVWEGKHLDVDALLAEAARRPIIQSRPDVKKKPPPPLEILTLKQLKKFAMGSTRSKDPYRAALGRSLISVCNGEIFADEGERDQRIFQLVSFVVETFPAVCEESLAGHFRLSLHLMAQHAPDCPTVEDVKKKIRNARKKQLLTQSREVAVAQQAQAARIQDAFQSDRTHPYTAQELDSFGRVRWIVQVQASFYFFVAGAYTGPYTRDEMVNAALRDLAPALTAGIQLEGEHGPKSIQRLVADYGMIASTVAADLAASKARYDEKSRTIIEAPCPLRAIEPREHPEIGQWLAYMAGERLHLLRGWISKITELNHPCTALFLTGPGGCGKSLLAAGLSRLWSDMGNPTPLADVLGDGFNGQQLQCPLTLADERLPTDYRGQVESASLRAFIQARQRPLRRKYRAPTTLMGCPRLIIAANNEQILSTNEDLTNDDLSAIADRYLWIPCQSKASTYLSGRDVSGWVEADAIAEHALWIQQAFPWRANGRFLVHYADPALHSRLSSGSGIRSSILQFCVGYLIDPIAIDSHPKGRFLIRVHDGRLMVNAKSILECWSSYVLHERCPTLSRITTALAGLADSDRIRLGIPGTPRRENYRAIKNEHLTAWALRCQYADAEQISAALLIDTEQRLIKRGRIGYKKSS